MKKKFNQDEFNQHIYAEWVEDTIRNKEEIERANSPIVATLKKLLLQANKENRWAVKNAKAEGDYFYPFADGVVSVINIIKQNISKYAQQSTNS